VDATIAGKITRDFLPSAFGSLEALLGKPFTFSAGAPQAGEASLLAQWCADGPVWLHARIAGGGAVAMLWPMADAARLVALTGGEDPAAKVVVNAADLAMLKELADTVIVRGAAGLTRLIGEVVRTEGTAADIGKGVNELTAVVGASPTGIELKFEGGDSSGRAILVFSQALEQRIAKRHDEPSAGGPIVSNEEVKDILSGFTPEQDHDRAGGRGAGSNGPVPENLAVIMDIELTAMARLGKVEVPLAEVLNYGPGSIIELGHMVDEPVELLVNGKLIARGDVVVVDEKFGLRITEIMSPQERIESLR
jgi:flagellar motor switch protein FliN